MASPCSWRWCCDTHLSNPSFSFGSRPRRSNLIRLSLDDHLIRGESSRTNFSGHKAGLELDAGSEAPRRPQIKTFVGDDGLVDDGTAPPSHISRLLLTNFKPFLRKRSLWKRIFFASAKVRSIILLNVLTVIYGLFFLLGVSVFYCFCISI